MSGLFLGLHPKFPKWTHVLVPLGCHSMIIPFYHIDLHLVGGMICYGIPTLLKTMKVSWDYEIPQIWKNNK